VGSDEHNRDSSVSQLPVDQALQCQWAGFLGFFPNRVIVVACGLDPAQKIVFADNVGAKVDDVLVKCEIDALCHD
jgi:hypothetical protein